MKGLLIVFFALFIDGLQAFVSLSLAGLVSTVGGTLQLVPFVGTALGGGIWASGIALGFIFTVSLTLSMGMALLLMLGMEGAFYPKIVFIGFFGEVTPGFGILPMWTALTVMCLIQKNKEKGGTMSGVATVALALAPGGSQRNILRTVTQNPTPQITTTVQEQVGTPTTKATSRTTQLQRIRSVDGITAIPKQA